MSSSYMKWNVFFLKVESFYTPEEDWNIFLKCGYYLWRLIWALSLFYPVVFSTMDIFMREDIRNISDVALNIVNIALYTSGIIRSIYFIYHGNAVKLIIKRINKEFLPKTTFAFEEYTMEKGVVLANRVLFTWTAFVILAGLFMVAGTFLTSERVLPMPVWAFYDWTQNPYYHITLAIQSLAQMNMVNSFSNLDMFNACFMILAGEQFEILGANFGSVFNDALHTCGCSQEEVLQYTSYISETNKIMRETLDEKIYDITRTPQFKKRIVANITECIKHHQQMLDLMEKYYRLISPILLIEAYFIFCYLIFMTFTFITTDDSSIYLGLSQYVGGSIAQIYMLTYFGERLATKADKMRMSIYNIPWYSCDTHFLKYFKFAHMRMGKSLLVKAGGLLEMSMETFLEFMKKAFSFFTVLRQVYQ